MKCFFFFPQKNLITGGEVGKSNIIYSVNMCRHQWGAGCCDESQEWLDSLDNGVHLINPQPSSSDWSNYAPPDSFLPNRSSITAKKIGKFPPQFFTECSEEKKKERENKLENAWEKKNATWWQTTWFTKEILANIPPKEKKKKPNPQFLLRVTAYKSLKVSLKF